MKKLFLLLAVLGRRSFRTEKAVGGRRQNHAGHQPTDQHESLHISRQQDSVFQRCEPSVFPDAYEHVAGNQRFGSRPVALRRTGFHLLRFRKQQKSVEFHFQRFHLRPAKQQAGRPHHYDGREIASRVGSAHLYDRRRPGYQRQADRQSDQPFDHAILRLYSGKRDA